MNDNLIIIEKYLRLEAPPELVKLIAEACRSYLESSDEYSKTFSDFLFNMETAYQTYHGLDQDDWGFTKDDLIEIGFMEVSDER